MGSKQNDVRPQGESQEPVRLSAEPEFVAGVPELEADTAEATDAAEQSSVESADWKKDIDLSRAVENLLVGVILFLGRYPLTLVQVLFRPAAIEKKLIFNPSYRQKTWVRFTRPLTFLVVSGFIFLSFNLKASGTPIPVEFILNHFKVLIDRLPKKVEDLSLAKIAVFMVPFVLLVAVFALVSSQVFRLLKIRFHFKIHFNIGCYVVGSLAVLLSCAALIEEPAWDWLLSHQTVLGLIGAITLLLVAIILWGGGLFTFYRYYDWVHRAGRKGHARTVSAALLSIISFYGVSAVLLYLLDPILRQLK